MPSVLVPQSHEHIGDKLSKKNIDWAWYAGLDQPHWTSAYGDQNQIMKHRMETTGREMERMYP